MEWANVALGAASAPLIPAHDGQWPGHPRGLATLDELRHGEVSSDSLLHEVRLL